MIIYNLIVRAYGLLIRLAALNNKKAAQWVSGRANWRQHLSDKIKPVGTKRVWVHCASYGEFEQGRPVMEAIKKQHPDHAIVLSFFSPSGYEAFHNWGGADVICYLPLDTKANARDFIEIVNPATVIFIKYEFWVNFLFELKKKNIPTFLISAVFKPHHPFFKWYGGLFRRSLTAFNKLFIQDEGSGQLLGSIGINNYEVCGDTRFDRVLDIKEQFQPLVFFEELCKNKTVIIGGSSWPKDEQLLAEAFQKLNDPNLLLILAPHNVDEKSIKAVEQQLQKYDLPYSLYTKQNANAGTRILVIDTIGLLSRSYHYADVAYIGGGFNSGIHNCLEPAVFLKPVLFGGDDDYKKYNEAVDLVRLGAAQNVADADALEKALRYFLYNPEVKQRVSEQLKAYFAKNSGTTKKVLALIDWGK